MWMYVVWGPAVDFLFASSFSFFFPGVVGDGCHCVAGQELTLLTYIEKKDLSIILLVIISEFLR